MSASRSGGRCTRGSAAAIRAEAITATARKLAILVYRTLKAEIVYQDQGSAAYLAQQRSRTLRHLRQRAESLGFALVNRETGELLEGAVS